MLWKNSASSARMHAELHAWQEGWTMSTLTKASKKKKVLGRGGKRRPAKVLSFGPTVVVPKGTTISVNGVRVRLGMSQMELARITGYSIRSIASWEGGKPLSESARQKLTETERLRIAL